MLNQRMFTDNAVGYMLLQKSVIKSNRKKSFEVVLHFSKLKDWYVRS